MNPFFFPALCAATFANLVVNAYDQGKTDTPPTNAVGHMVLASVASSTATVVVSTVVVHSILDAVYQTCRGGPDVVQLDVVGSTRG
jgi:hypothetical protein